MDKYEEFLALAKSDLKVATMVIDSATDELVQNIAAYHVEQAVEKIMKGLLVKNDGFAGISHNITELSKDLDELSVSYPEWIHDKDDQITSWATTIRYNANFKADHDEIIQIIDDTNKWIKQLESGQ